MRKVLVAKRKLLPTTANLIVQTTKVPNDVEETSALSPTTEEITTTTEEYQEYEDETESGDETEKDGDEDTDEYGDEEDVDENEQENQDIDEDKIEEEKSKDQQNNNDNEEDYDEDIQDLEENEKLDSQKNISENVDKILPTSSKKEIDSEDEKPSTPLFQAEEDEDSREKQVQNFNTLPDYEPFFPELTESIDAPVLLLKTTVLPTVEYETKTVVQSRLRTYTFIVTRINGDEKMTTSTTEIRPQTKTLTVTEPHTRFTTLTLLDWEATNVLPFIPLTNSMETPITSPEHTEENEAKLFEEARYNLATRVMSNGVEVIVASDKTTLPGEPDVRRIPPSSIYKPITLKPSTLSNHMSLLVPQDASQIESLSASLQSNPFVTKTCLTTFTYLTTYLQNGMTKISSHEQVISNIATEEKNSAKIVPTSSAGVTLTQHPNLAVGVFQTTYTYLNTILDGEQPLVVSSKHVVSNTITAPDDFLSLLQPSEKATPVRETNTYYSTLPLKKTVKDAGDTKVISTEETLTQVIITQSIPPKSTSVMTSYIALDVDERPPNNRPHDYTTTDVVKTYYVTYTYYSTDTENNTPVVKTNVAISSDVVTEKLYINPQKTASTKPSKLNGQTVVRLPENVEILATKTYVTTYTYYTTLLQNDKNKSTSTVVKSHTKQVENVVTETLDANSIRPENLVIIGEELQKGHESVIQTASLIDGQKIEITAIYNNIKPTKVLPIEKTQMPTTPLDYTHNVESSSPSIITGSTIVFFDDDNDPFKAVSKKATPTLKQKVKVTKTAIKNELNSLLSSEIVKNTKISTVINKQSSKKSKVEKRPTVSPTKTKDTIPITEVNKYTNNGVSENPPPKKNIAVKNPDPGSNIPDLLGLGAINVDTLSALTPVISVMTGLLKANMQNNKRNETVTVTTHDPPRTTVKERHKEPPHNEVAEESQNKPIYIPLQADDDSLVIAESQNIATFHIKQWEKLPSDKLKNQKESPLLNGGISISPGEIITANSDVIVGKSGRIGPRVPAIPLKNLVNDEIPIGMKPPPLPHHNAWPNQNSPKFKDPISSGSVKNERPHFGKETFLRPPAPVTIPLRPSGIVRNENPKRHMVNKPNKNPFIIPASFNNQSPPQLNHDEILTRPNNQSNMNIPIQPSALNELIVLPEIIERSSNQPLLVNLQPSQVAYVNIPHNRSTALIYGGSTEPHVNGQYFDDPSPYSQVNFVSPSDSYNNVGIMKVDTVQDNFQSSNQKRVVGVIKVGTDVINVNPSSSVSVGSSHKIQPSRPLQSDNNKDVNINVPPLSFGMIQQGGEVNGHVINHHDSITFQSPPMTFDVVASANNNNKNNSFGQPNNYHPHDFKYHYRITSPVRGSNRRPPFGNRRQPQKPILNIRPPANPLEFMTPPRPSNQFTPPKSVKPSKEPEASNTIPISSPTNDDFEPEDSYNEDGEYVQESNNRPLLPNEVPLEILKLNVSRQKPLIKNNESVNVIKATNIPFVRPENQLTNQIVKPEETSHYVPSNSFDNSGNYRPNVQDSNRTNIISTTPYLNTEERFPQTTEDYLQNSQSSKFSNTHTNKVTSRPSQGIRGSVIKHTENENSLNRDKLILNRPKVTSMPVDPLYVQKEDINRKSQIETQTEKPFNPDFIVKNSTEEKQNSPSTDNKNEFIYSMEVMKPPPPPSSSNPPYISVEMKPPKLNGYGKKKNPFNFLVLSSSPRPFVRNPTMTENILGMNPPAITTYKPSLKFNLTVTSFKPPLSSQESVEYSTTLRPRRPFRRKTTPRTTTITKTYNSDRETFDATVRPVFRNRHRSTTENYKDNSSSKTTDTTATTTTTTEKAPPRRSSTRKRVTAVTSRPKVDLTTKRDHTASETVVNNNHNPEVPLVKPSKVELPTHEETHVRTFTTTTIRTTVIKTLNGPPSTSTILVTKTEKYTVVDTVTEIHTLLKPTSIYETITTTISPSTQLYTPSIEPKTVTEIITTTPQLLEDEDDDLEDFIIRDNDLPSILTHENHTNVKVKIDNTDSIFVVMTDKNKGSVVKIPETETQNRDEIFSDNDANHILLGGVLIAPPPNVEQPSETSTDNKNMQDRCIPECQASKNELCQRVEGIMRCVCRPGFARMFPDRPCKPTYTYRLKIVLERLGKQRLMYHYNLNNTNSTEFVKLSSITQDGLDRMVMQSDLRDIYHGIQVENYEPLDIQEGIVTNFYLQLSENTNDDRLKEILKKYLRSNNYSIGGTELFAAREGVENLDADDFDECSNKEFHDCSENAHCFNLPGTYTCSCKEGFSDLSVNILYPGRICSAELIGCERCNYHGTCYSRGDDQMLCECFHWYAGDKCHVNLKVLLIALITLGILLFILLIVCLIMTCAKGRRHHQNSAFATGMSFMPQRVAIPDSRRITLERRAMIQDTSSESGQSDTLPYEAKVISSKNFAKQFHGETLQKTRKNSKGALKKPTPLIIVDPNITDTHTVPLNDQKDRSLPVMIPRAKYHAAPPTLNPELNDNRKNSVVSNNNEAKLLSYLDAGPTPNAKAEGKRKYSSAASETYLPETVGHRKPSTGALVSAGFEVSATVSINNVNNLGTLDRTCGTEADRSENATLIHKISADLISNSGTRSQFNTLRDDFIDPENEDSLTNWLEITPKITKTVSEARSCDETTVQLPTKSLRNGYDVSSNCNDEANTMAERDVGSTFLLPHTHLYKPDRGSDISGFDSL